MTKTAAYDIFKIRTVNRPIDSVTAEGGESGHGEGMHVAKRACKAELTAEQPHKASDSGEHGGMFWKQLTPEQREELHATIAELKEAGASKEEFHQAVTGLFAEWGIESPHKASSGVCPKSEE